MISKNTNINEEKRYTLGGTNNAEPLMRTTSLNKLDFDKVNQSMGKNPLETMKERQSSNNLEQDEQHESVNTFFDEMKEVNIDQSLGNNIVDINEYKKEHNLLNENNEQKIKRPLAFKSKLSEGAEEFSFTELEKGDTVRMSAVKTALSQYYMNRDAEVDKDNTQEAKDLAIHQSLQNIVNTCNAYIANRWPLSTSGRKRLAEVKDLRKNAIKEMGEKSGHPGWGLAKEYLKFGLKAVTAPVWAPTLAVATGIKYTGKYVGRVTKRIAKKSAHGIKRFFINMGDGFARNFGGWRATLSTLLAGTEALFFGTILNVVNTAIMATLLPFWLIGSMVTYPRFLYHLAKGDVNLKANSSGIIGANKKSYRAMAFSMPTPHLYSTWFKFFNGPAKASFDKIGKKKSTDKNMIYTGEDKNAYFYASKKRQYGKEYESYSTFLGPIRSVYYHRSTQKIANFLSLFDYNAEKKEKMQRMRAEEDMYMANVKEEEKQFEDDKLDMDEESYEKSFKSRGYYGKGNF